MGRKQSVSGRDRGYQQTVRLQRQAVTQAGERCSCKSFTAPHPHPHPLSHPAGAPALESTAARLPAAGRVAPELRRNRKPAGVVSPEYPSPEYPADSHTIDSLVNSTQESRCCLSNGYVAGWTKPNQAGHNSKCVHPRESRDLKKKLISQGDGGREGDSESRKRGA